MNESCRPNQEYPTNRPGDLTRFYYIDRTTLVAARDIGLQGFYNITKIIVPLSKVTATTCFLLNFLLAFNEYPRTYYLSGSNVLLSEFLHGKPNSGADESIYDVFSKYYNIEPSASEGVKDLLFQLINRLKKL